MPRRRPSRRKPQRKAEQRNPKKLIRITPDMDIEKLVKEHGLDLVVQSLRSSARYEYRISEKQVRQLIDLLKRAGYSKEYIAGILYALGWKGLADEIANE
ncbi:MAG: hypothetical protein J7L14_01765 [Candidatus Diapherotrites archaeon]|nr:hypothetical protein [Candidatus Diapherotrites archaeon]